MKKIISFNKDLDFPSMIGEITSIALDNNLKFVDKNTVEGKFVVSGSYKMTEATTFEEKFNYDIPVEITLTETFDLSNVSISIDDFRYEIVNDDILKCDIDVLIDGLEEIEIDDEEEIEELRECDGEKEEKQKEIPKKNIEENKLEINDEQLPEKEIIKNDNQKLEEVTEEIDDVVDTTNQNISSLFESLGNAEETFSTYSVYIFRKDDTLEKIISEYNTTKELLSDYNDLNNIEIGSKIIIPSTND